MGLRIIHTGDLHIGQSLLRISRAEEHRRLLNWLHQTLLEQQADALVISGDVFDHALPSAKTQRIFYEFLGGLNDIDSLKSVVITAGNHDSAQLLQAMNPVTRRIGIHIVGADKNRSDDWRRWLIPVKGESGEYEAVIAAVPFVHEFRLGIRMSSGSRLEHAGAIRKAFSDLYHQFAKWASVDYPNLPLLGMGHFTAVSDQEILGICPQQVHIALENGLDGSIFPDEYAYVALGHIHKNYRIRGNANAYYCGSPLACSIAEAEDGSTRGAWMVEFSEQKEYRPTPQRMKIPQFRQMKRFKGTIDELQERIKQLEWPDEQSPPMLWLEAHTATNRFDLPSLFESLLSDLPIERRPFIVKIDNVISHQVPSTVSPATSTGFLDPVDAFEQLLRFKSEDVDDVELRALFTLALQKARSE